MSKNQETEVLVQVDGQWRVATISGIPRFERADGRFFSVEFDDSLGYIQPVVRENCDAEGICGSVLPLVRLADNEWEVAVCEVKRVGANGCEMLLEAARNSVDNAKLVHYPVTELGIGRSNSARIIGTIRCGVVDVTETGRTDYLLPPNGQWMTFAQFARESSDMMAQAALFRFLCKIQGNS